MRLALALAATAALLVVPPANAALPKFKNKEIVIHKSLGGVKLGGSVKSAKNAWGKNGAECFEGYCQYRKSRDNLSAGEGTFSFKDGKIVGITLRTGSDVDGPVFKKPFTQPKTDKGIGIGSTKKQVKKAYPKIKDDGNGYLTLQKGNKYMEFLVGDGNRVGSIGLQILPED